MQMIGLPAGFRDVLFEEAKARRTIETRMAGLFERLGFGEVQPSGVESLELYQRGHQGVLDRAFRFLDRQDNLLALRADFTPAIARIAATRLAASELPIRIWYSGSVYRKVNAAHGGFAEVGQIGAELLGLDSIEADVEILRLAMECLASIGIDDIQVHINHAGVIRGIVDALGIKGKDLRSIKSQIDRKDARGIDSQLRSLNVEKDLQTQVHTLASSVGGTSVLERARQTIRNDESLRAISHLLALAGKMGPWKEKLVFDLAEIDEMEYYTGIMVAFLSPKLNKEVGTGGRYDSLLKEFGRDLPAVGFSFLVESLVELQ